MSDAACSPARSDAGRRTGIPAVAPQSGVSRFDAMRLDRPTRVTTRVGRSSLLSG
jgi:hypothetical protein